MLPFLRNKRLLFLLFLQLWIKSELAKKANSDSGAVAEIGERFILNNSCTF